MQSIEIAQISEGLVHLFGGFTEVDFLPTRQVQATTIIDRMDKTAVVLVRS